MGAARTDDEFKDEYERARIEREFGTATGAATGSGWGAGSQGGRGPGLCATAVRGERSDGAVSELADMQSSAAGSAGALVGGFDDEADAECQDCGLGEAGGGGGCGEVHAAVEARTAAVGGCPTERGTLVGGFGSGGEGSDSDGEREGSWSGRHDGNVSGQQL